MTDFPKRPSPRDRFALPASRAMARVILWSAAVLILLLGGCSVLGPAPDKKPAPKSTAAVPAPAPKADTEATKEPHAEETPPGSPAANASHDAAERIPQPPATPASVMAQAQKAFPPTPAPTTAHPSPSAATSGSPGTGEYTAHARADAVLIYTTPAPKAVSQAAPQHPPQAPAPQSPVPAAVAPPQAPAATPTAATADTDASAPVTPAPVTPAPATTAPPKETSPTPDDTSERLGKKDENTFGLNIQHLDVGVPLDRFGSNLAVLPGPDGRKALGLNGVDSSVAYFPGMGLATFGIDARMAYNFPIHEGGKVSAHLMTLKLGSAAERRLAVTITQAEAEPPMARFSLEGPSLAPDMLCSEKPVRWKEDMPGTVSDLAFTKEASGLFFSYDGQLICTSPLDPSLKLTGFSANLVNARTLIADMTLTRRPDTPQPGSPHPGQFFTADTLGQPFPPASLAHEGGMTRINVSALATGMPVGTFTQNLVVLGDDEGKYVASTSPQGSDVLFPVAAATDYSVDILVKNAFVLSDRNNRTDRFFLFTITYKNGVREVYSVSLTRNDKLIWNSRYTIDRSGPNVMNWSVSTDYRPWDNALDFNEYKVIKEKDLVRFFFNGEFIRNERTMGDAITSVKVVLRQDERLYDVIVRDLAIIRENKEKKAVLKERGLDDGATRPTADGGGHG